MTLPVCFYWSEQTYFLAGNFIATGGQASLVDIFAGVLMHCLLKKLFFNMSLFRFGM